ncbi:MAG: hypothetical protein UT08_C0013G0021 [Candidatus Woesebacteria bacterium GW2011_GWB1_38_8]|uniref:Transmembrane protein n=1 Tax=Candidatus Woesebacteria bacterium GW2011_GWB1_38_8 TaxID=1618570 RepID=A0A0G0NG55_9BACT|nr:MAG: hypothetical protein UT08_C0013G0021 [Candidatus Woesebacteria bacterium GW2011_GWB1_38_8]
MQTIEQEDKHIFEILAIFMVFGMFLGWGAYKQNPYDYVCIDESARNYIYYENCMEDCNIGEYECLSSCGCGEIERRKDNPLIEVIVGGLGGITLWSLYMVLFKGY